MARKSSITTQLSPEDIARLNRKLGEGKMTHEALADWLGELGYGISRSAVQRHSVGITRMASSIRQSRQITEALVAELGDSAALGQQGRMLVEAVRTLVMELLAKIQSDDESAIGPKEAMQLSRSIADLSRALRSDQDYETRVQEQAEKKIMERAVSAIEEIASTPEKGLSRDTVDLIKGRILGVKEGAVT